MSRVLVIFGTTHGQTEKIASAIGARLRYHQHEVDVLNASSLPSEPHRYDGVVAAASLHAGAYQEEIVTWVREHAGLLNQRPTAFVSVCLGVLQQDPKVDHDLQTIITAFLKTVGWTPSEVTMVAGALKYTRYNPLVRWLMKRIARKAGGGTDTSRDYEYTDWAAVDAFVDRFTERLSGTTAAFEAPAASGGD
jgi:menaquinone-dependent protoporphyrinogen oxidase